MFSSQKTNAAKRIAIDTGAYRTRLCSANKGLLLDQPSVATLDMDHPIGGSKAVDVFGDQAEAQYSQGLDGLRKIRPVQSDRHNDLGFSAKMLFTFLNQASQSGLISKSPEILLTLNHDCMKSTGARLVKACKEAGAREIKTLNTAIAAFHNTELEASDPCIMIDFGATSSRLVAIAEGKVVHFEKLSCGGDALDRAITLGLLERYSLFISEDSAREIKHSVAAATPQSFVQCTRSSCQVDCLSVKTNKNSTFRVSSETINEILQPSLETLGTSITKALGNIDRSLQQTACENGIRLTGGGALLPRMEQLVIAATEMPVEIIRRPMNSNVRGAASTMIEVQAETDDEYLEALS